MLMYRQIADVNEHFMQKEDFPPHVKDLVGKLNHDDGEKKQKEFEHTYLTEYAGNLKKENEDLNLALSKLRNEAKDAQQALFVCQKEFDEERLAERFAMKQEIQDLKEKYDVMKTDMLQILQEKDNTKEEIKLLKYNQALLTQEFTDLKTQLGDLIQKWGKDFVSLRSSDKSNQGARSFSGRRPANQVSATLFRILLEEMTSWKNTTLKRIQSLEDDLTEVVTAAAQGPVDDAQAEEVLHSITDVFSLPASMKFTYFQCTNLTRKVLKLEKSILSFQHKLEDERKKNRRLSEELLKKAELDEESADDVLASDSEGDGTEDVKIEDFEVPESSSEVSESSSEE